ncbi:fibronectin type III domain-containing protein [Candidatus Aquiluna sp. UB-MaderosW2red]|uniref:fibronectin type III domain-containing protein n=1 Tax=Candidatus Aquiluna sp. UB-MaderosW2red TaxID=1855377 RepID=UPI000875DA82|nr:fibronectin type III domain-containing protein [Candidatus Aquiluna sp. UB-MaderosW2red]SCX05658.1 Fibronectin type III domain-containing protein [Candidatus Aquiluna sp. UB-MaderosW2red]
MKKLAVVALLSLIASLATPAHSAPAKPTNLAVSSTSPAGTATDQASATVTWTGSSNALTYAVSATAPGVTSINGSALSCAGTACTAVLAGMTGGADYSVIVTAVDNAGATTASDSFLFEARSIPFAPTVNAPTLNNGQVTLTWGTPDNGGQVISKYVISSSGFTSADVAANLNTFTTSNLNAGQAYIFRLVAVSSLGASEQAVFDSITFAAVPIVPGAPTASSAGSSITVSWVAPVSNGDAITSYSVFLLNNDGDDVGTPSTPSPAISTSLTLSNLTSGTYTLRVSAANRQGSSARSIASTPVVISSGALANKPVFSPSNLTSMDIGTDASLTATAPSGGQVAVAVAALPLNACTYSAGRVFAVASGTCTLTSTIPANSTFSAGTETRVITIKAAQSITFPPISDKFFPGAMTLAATSTSDLVVRYSVSGPCSVSGSLLSFSGVGSCTVTASQPGNNTFSAAQPRPQSFQISSASSQVGGSGGGGSGAGGSTGPTSPGTPGNIPKNPGGETGSGLAMPGAKVNAGSFKGYVAIYAKNHQGQRLSAKVGKDWVIVKSIPAAKNNLYRHVEFTGVGVRIQVRVFINGALQATIPLLTK